MNRRQLFPALMLATLLLVCAIAGAAPAASDRGTTLTVLLLPPDARGDVDAATRALVESSIAEFAAAARLELVPVPRGTRTGPGSVGGYVIEDLARMARDRGARGFLGAQLYRSDGAIDEQASVDVWNRRLQPLSLGSGGFTNMEEATSFSLRLDVMTRTLRAPDVVARARGHLLAEPTAASPVPKPADGSVPRQPDVSLLLERRIATIEKQVRRSKPEESARWDAAFAKVRRFQGLGQDELAFRSLEEAYLYGGQRPPLRVAAAAPAILQIESFETALGNVFLLRGWRHAPRDVTRLLDAHRAAIVRLEAGHPSEAVALLSAVRPEIDALLEALKAKAEVSAALASRLRDTTPTLGANPGSQGAGQEPQSSPRGAGAR